MALIHYFILVIFFILTVLTGGYAYAGHPQTPTENHEQIVKESFVYALLSVNAYETQENTPFVLPACIKEVRHEDSRLSDPSPKYVHSNVYDKGSFQAKIFEITCDENDPDTRWEVVIAYRGTQNFLGGDMVKGTLTDHQRKIAVRLYEEIKEKYSNKKAVISLTGHSLGGALALEVAYTYNQDPIKAYVFNSSYHISRELKDRAPSTNGKVISIEEEKDPVMAPLRHLWQTPTGLRVYQVDYAKTLIAGNHSRHHIACGLLKEAKERKCKMAEQIFELNTTICQ